MSEYTLKEHPTREEHDEIIDLTFKVWNDDSITSIIRITHGPFISSSDSATDLEATISQDKEQAWNRHINDPASYAPFVVYVPTGEIVGTIAWKIYKDPFLKPDRVRLPWPESDKEGKECSEEIVNQCFYPRANWMNGRRMATMDDTTVRQDHQRKGVGSMLVKWGIEKADELGIECFVEATDAGRSLYLKFGFMNLMKVLVDAENGTKERHEMIKKLSPQPVQYWAMWRPRIGDGAPRTLWEAIEMNKS